MRDPGDVCVLFSNLDLLRFVPSQADTAVFKALSGAPKSDTAHALRWYNHIKSFAAGMDQFAKASKDASAYVSGGDAAASKDDDDDDVDLFGSDEESDDEEKKRITEERLKAYHEKKVGKEAKLYFFFQCIYLVKETQSDCEDLRPLRCEALG